MDIIFDLDGTLADLTHRRPYAKGPEKDYRRFFSECDKDTLITDVAKLYRMFASEPMFMMNIVSGRSDECEGKTIDWLDKHGIWYDNLYMRKAGDYRPDDIVKKEILDEHWPGALKNDIFAIFDDRDRVVSMWRANGLRCYQVAPGAF